jgi:beta-N-acetylhexosaminidase
VIPLLAALALAGPAEAQAPPPAAERRPIETALGQMIVARYAGRTPPSSLLARVRRGQVGGVILFADNVGSDAGTRRAIRRLQAAARDGGHPELLVMLDQEGGTVKRVRGAPSRPAAAMTTAARARREGLRTGRRLRGLGVTLNLAPVADVGRRGSFLGTRAFGRSGSVVAARACAFADGLRRGGVGATLKHFPGLGHAPANTDDRRATVRAPLSVLRREQEPYRRCGRRPATLVMVSSATYTALDRRSPAVLARRTYAVDLPRVAGRALTISDDLETPAIRGRRAPARRAVNAGLDLLLYAGTESASASAYSGLLADVRAGRISRATIHRSAERIVGAKGEIRALAAGG